MNTDFPAAVIDTSFFISAILNPYCSDEADKAVKFITDIIRENGKLVVPQLFWFEIGNILLNASKPHKDGTPGRITESQLTVIEQNIAKLPIYTAPQPNSEERLRIRALASKENLTYYDATYLELALRMNLPLKTLDKALEKKI